MTTRERVLASRLIQKIENNESYAKQIGLSYRMSLAGIEKSDSKPTQQKRKTNFRKESDIYG